MNSVFINISENVKNKSVLILSDDMELIEELKPKEDMINFKMSYFEHDKAYLISNKLSLFDVVVFDNRGLDSIDKFSNLFKTTNKYELNIPVIILDSDIKEDLTVYKNCNVFTLLFDPINVDILTSNITLCLNYLYKNKKVELEQGYHFDINRELFFHDKKIIKLTKTERALMKLLIERQNQLVTYETIERKVWKDTNFSKYTLRNIVKHIRKKSDDSVIKNSSNRGYIVNTF